MNSNWKWVLLFSVGDANWLRVAIQRPITNESDWHFTFQKEIRDLKLKKRIELQNENFIFIILFD